MFVWSMMTLVTNLGLGILHAVSALPGRGCRVEGAACAVPSTGSRVRTRVHLSTSGMSVWGHTKFGCPLDD
jgi:hypothetical protein